MTGMIKVTGTKRVARNIRGMADRTEDLTPAWPKVGNYLSSRVKRQFMTSGKQFNTPWKPLNAKYRLWKIRSGYSKDILVQTGKMKTEFTGRPMDIEVYSRQSAKFGSNSQKAVWQHYGTTRNGKKHIPARKILVVTREVRADVKDIIERHIKSGRRY